MGADITPEMQQPPQQSNQPPGAPPPPPPPEGAQPAQPPQQPQQQVPPGTVTTDAAGRRWWWDGTQWRPVAAARRNFRWAWSLIALVVLVVGYAVVHNTGSTPTISNAKIDSSTQIEFDYHAGSNCNNLTFTYTFKDSSGSTVDTWNGESSHSVQSGRDYHITASADPQNGQAIASGATSFDVTPTCHDQ
jgi:hypothetical protein